MEFRVANLYAGCFRAALAAFLAIGIGLAASISAQDGNLFDTLTVERSLKYQYGLTSKELSMLRPVLRQQNLELVIIFHHCLEEEQTDYHSLWTAILSKREEFESASVKGITPRQRQIIRTARLKFELRILNEWRSFYVEELASFLELDWLQSTILAKIFQKDQDARLRMITASSPQRFESSWQKLSEDLERQLEQLLSPRQLKDYRQLNAKDGRPVA